MLPDFIELSILNVLVSDIYLSCRKKEEEEGERGEEREKEREGERGRIKADKNLLTCCLE